MKRQVIMLELDGLTEEQAKKLAEKIVYRLREVSRVEVTDVQTEEINVEYGHATIYQP